MVSVKGRSRPVAVALVLLTLAACDDRGVPREANGDRPSHRGAMGESMGRMGPGMTQRDGSMGMALPEGVLADDLPAPDSRGARLAARFCSGCHGIPSPGRYGEEAWPDVLDRMFRRLDRTRRMSRMRNRRMGRRGGGRMPDAGIPSADERRDLRAYYREHALAEAEEDRLPDLEGRDAFRAACSRCHGLPDPGSRPPEAWPEIVQRMRGHMERTEGIDGLTDAEAGTIAGYLQRAAPSGRQPL